MKSALPLLLIAVLLGGGVFQLLRSGATRPETPTEALGPILEGREFSEDGVRRPAGGGTSRPTPTWMADGANGAGTNWIALNNEANEDLSRDDYEGAAAKFRECFEARPEEPVFRRNLGITLAQLADALADSAEAADRIRALEIAAEAVELLEGDERQAVQLRLERWIAAANTEADFFTYGNDRFELAYDGERDSLRSSEDRILQILDAADQEFREAFETDPLATKGKRLRVVFYRREQFDKVTGLGHWAGGVFDGTVRVPVENLPRQLNSGALERVLRHELLHAFVSNVGGTRVPAWLNEGLAQWVEQPNRRAMAVAEARQRLERQELFPLVDLRRGLSTWKDADAIARAYAQSLALADWIVVHYGESVLFAMVQACGEKSTPDKAFAERVGFELALVVQDLAESL
jgi:hypothetical protein